MAEQLPGLSAVSAFYFSASFWSAAAQIHNVLLE
jgi:hypothetical protein